VSTERRSTTTEEPAETKSKKQSRSSTTDPSTGADDGAAGEANLDQVRDLLFGSSMRTVEQQIGSLEGRLLAENAAVRDAATAKYEQLEALFRQELTALTDRVTAEQAERGADLEALAQKLQGTSEALEHRVQALQATLNESGKALDAQLLAQTEALTAQLQQASAEITSRLDHELREVWAAKADRASLAALFAEFAARLNEESPQPEGD
jgi:Skp family chaperone for outer membrane proteins